MMKKYLKEYHYEDITELLNNINYDTHVSIMLDLINLKQYNCELFHNIMRKPFLEMEKWDCALLQVQKMILEDGNNLFLGEHFQIKENCHVRFINLPVDPSVKQLFPTNNDINKFIQIKGIVIRMTQPRILEYRKEYICRSCKDVQMVTGEFLKMYVIDEPKMCSNMCKSKPTQQSTENLQIKNCKDYQEIRIQEMNCNKSIPPILNIILENDLVDTCQPGDCITVCGTIERQWKPLQPGKRIDVNLTMYAISVHANGKRGSMGRDLPEQLLCARTDWQELIDTYDELRVRDTLIRSICPDLFGMNLLKLAVALILSSGPSTETAATAYTSSSSSSSSREKNEMNMTRRDSHLLLIGDPGIAKSKLLRFANTIIMKSVFTTGLGSTAAGLTASAVKDQGEWHLEAGALVLADTGVCCIDEFNWMRPAERTSIHEAMEQQTISIAKAGIICSLSARCSILAACNFKKIHDKNEIGIESPLLSRFDLIFMLYDEQLPEWDECLANHVLFKNYARKKDDDDDDDDDDDGNSNSDDGQTSDNQSCNIKWDIKKLQLHFIAIRNIECKILPDAMQVLEAYFNYCRNDPYRDRSRTTVRLFCGLKRLACAHAKLLYRDCVMVIDTIIVIQLMESSYGFGHLIKPRDMIRSGLPLGPTKQNIIDICNALALETDSIMMRIEMDERNTKRNSIQSTEKTSHFFQNNNNSNSSKQTSTETTNPIENTITIHPNENTKKKSNEILTDNNANEQDEQENIVDDDFMNLIRSKRKEATTKTVIDENENSNKIKLPLEMVKRKRCSVELISEKCEKTNENNFKINTNEHEEKQQSNNKKIQIPNTINDDLDRILSFDDNIIENDNMVETSVTVVPLSTVVDSSNTNNQTDLNKETLSQISRKKFANKLIKFQFKKQKVTTIENENLSTINITDKTTLKENKKQNENMNVNHQSVSIIDDDQSINDNSNTDLSITMNDDEDFEILSSFNDKEYLQNNSTIISKPKFLTQKPEDTSSFITNQSQIDHSSNNNNNNNIQPKFCKPNNGKFQFRTSRIIKDPLPRSPSKSNDHKTILNNCTNNTNNNQNLIKSNLSKSFENKKITSTVVHSEIIPKTATTNNHTVINNQINKIWNEKQSTIPIDEDIDDLVLSLQCDDDDFFNENSFENDVNNSPEIKNVVSSSSSDKPTSSRTSRNDDLLNTFKHMSNLAILNATQEDLDCMNSLDL